MSSTDLTSKLIPPGKYSRLLLARAAWVLVLWHVLFLITFPVQKSAPPYTRPNLLPPILVVALGGLLWVTMLICCLESLRRPEVKPSWFSSAIFFLVFGVELLVAAQVLRTI